MNNVIQGYYLSKEFLSKQGNPAEKKDVTSFTASHDTFKYQQYLPPMIQSNNSATHTQSTLRRRPLAKSVQPDKNFANETSQKVIITQKVAP